MSRDKENNLIYNIYEVMMLYFKTELFNDEKDFRIAIDCVYKAYMNYNLEEYGYEFDFTRLPKFNYGASMQMGQNYFNVI